MDQSAQTSAIPRIDLTHAADVAFWCRVFDVTIEELREAVRHAGHQVPEIRRYLCSKTTHGVN